MVHMASKGKVHTYLTSSFVFSSIRYLHVARYLLLTDSWPQSGPLYVTGLMQYRLKQVQTGDLQQSLPPTSTVQERS